MFLGFLVPGYLYLSCDPRCQNERFGFLAQAFMIILAFMTETFPILLSNF